MQNLNLTNKIPEKVKENKDRELEIETKVKERETYTAAAMPEANSHRREQDRYQYLTADFTAIRHFHSSDRRHSYIYEEGNDEIRILDLGEGQSFMRFQCCMKIEGW